MSEADVIAVFGPAWVQDRDDYNRAWMTSAENHIYGLRCWLRAGDPALPAPYDGVAWQAALEQFYTEVAARP